MKGFKLNSSGDVEIINGQIQMVSGKELLRQTVQSVISTNKGEWVLNPNEGISFSNILGKIPPKENNNQAEKQYYQHQMNEIRDDYNDSIEKLARRLDGET